MQLHIAIGREKDCLLKLNLNTQLDQEKKNTKYSWGNEGIEENQFKANSWNGNFPSLNTNKDKFYYSAPVGSFFPKRLRHL